MKIEQTSDGLNRCWWCTATEQYIAYHDTDWGVPTADDRTLFEKITLESFQSGLSWRTILEKRDGFRRGFANFDIATVAAFDDADIDRLLNDTGIVRHRGKITATINNANRALEAIATHGSLATFLWSFADPSDLGSGTVQRGTSPAAEAMSKAMKKLGWKFVGPTTAYAFMQATGMVNDHVEGCHHRAISAAAIAGFTRP